jgi:6-phosphogluconolactonase
MRVLIGSYADEIAAFEYDGQTQTLIPTGLRVQTPAPSFLAVHPTLAMLYAVSEVDEGSIAAFRLDDEFSPVARLATGGAQPCHVAVSPDGWHVAVANYASGSVSVFETDADGGLMRRTAVVQHAGSGPVRGRQEGPHAHQVILGDDVLHAIDLGTDCIVHYGLSRDGRLERLGASYSRSGNGPRHFVTHPSLRHFVTDELSSTVSTFDASFRLVSSIPATLVEPATDNYPSELTLSFDGQFLYVANRGNDSIVTFSVQDDGLKPLDEVSTGGSWPRHMAIVGDSLLVANQTSGDVTALRLDAASGLPRDPQRVLEIPSPACVLPIY